MSKYKNHTMTWWKTKAWDEFSIYVRLRDSWTTTRTLTHANCCSCGKMYPSFGKGCLQAGHFVAGRTHILLFEEHGVHAQCYNCNHTLKGNTHNYRDFMIAKYGEEETVRIEMSRFNKTFKYHITEFEELRDKYKQMAKEIMACGRPE